VKTNPPEQGHPPKTAVFEKKRRVKMKKLLIAAGIVAASATGAFAQSSILDVYQPAPAAVTKIDYTATAALDRDDMAPVKQYPRLGDGAPPATTSHKGLDFSATAAIHHDHVSTTKLGPRLGDGAPLAS
jgi:hypothetical protein